MKMKPTGINWDNFIKELSKYPPDQLIWELEQKCKTFRNNSLVVYVSEPEGQTECINRNIAKNIFEFLDIIEILIQDCLEMDTTRKKIINKWIERERKELNTSDKEQTTPLTDIPHQITTPVAENIFSTDNYKKFDYQIQENGFYNVSINNQQVKVYTPELMVLFTSKDLALINYLTDEKTTINGRDYLETYSKGFNEGQQHFDSNFAANGNTLYGANSEQYVNDIHFNYFHKQHENNKDGWHYYKTSYPLLITHKEISKYGFYAGIISKVEELAAQYPQRFKNFENCEHKTEHPEPQATAKGKPVQTETLANNELQTILNSQNSLIDKVPIKEVYDHFEVLTEITNKFNEFYLTKEQLLIFIKATFIDLKPIKQKFNCSFIRKDIRKVFYKFYCNCMNKEPNQKNLKKKYFGILNNAFEGFNKNDFNDFHKI